MWINRDFFLLWTGQLISQIGDRFYAIALAWWVLEKTNSPAAMGFFMVASMLPELLFGLVAGGLIDRWNRKTILITADVVRGLAVIMVTLMFWWGTLEIWHIFIAAVVISLSSAFFNPTVMAIVPRLVDKENIPKANSLSQLITGLSTVTGPVLGATFVSLAGFGPVFLINGLSYLISVVLEGFIVLPAVPIQQQPRTKLLKDIKEGFKFISSSKSVFVILIIIGIVHIFYGSLLVTMPFLAKSLSGKGIRNLAYLETALGTGMILGAIVTGRQKLKNVQGNLLFAVTFVMGFCFALTGVISSLKIAVNLPYIAIMALIGLAAAIASVYWRSLLQVHVPNEMAGRVFSVSTMIADLSLPVSFSLFGMLLKQLSISQTLVYSGISLLIIGLSLMFKYRRII